MPPRTNFAEHVAGARPANRRLQLFHTCDGFTVRSVIEDKKLRAFPRDSFGGEKILFVYYGRPAYRLSAHDDPTSHSFFLPICLILSPDTLPSPKRIFPFDTGAFEAGLFGGSLGSRGGGSLHPGMGLSDFEIFPQPDMPQKLVSAFFGTNDRYFRGQPLSDVQHDVLDFEVEAYLSILRGEASLSQTDDRRSVIEIHSGDNILLEDATLEAVILPGIFLDNARVRDFFIRTCRAQPLPYEVFHFRVKEYMSEIYRLAMSYMSFDDD